MDIKTMLTILQIIVAAANICIMAFAFFKFLDKPHSSMDKRVTTLEIKVREIEDSMRQGNDRFREQSITNEVIQRSLMALVEFEIQYCVARGIEISDELKKAKEELHNYLTRGNRRD